MTASRPLVTSSLIALAALVGVAIMACRGDAEASASGKPAAPPATSAGESRATPASGRPWTPPSAAELAERKKHLSADQFHVTQEEGTEPPFNNAYWNNHEDGIYVDVVSGEPLFSSRDKFDSGTGWPSFSAPLEKANVVTRTDTTLGMTRTEVRSRLASSHLGHLFDDGPAPTGKRYCMDSASLRFIPASRLAAEGYPQYTKLFAASTRR